LIDLYDAKQGFLLQFKYTKLTTVKTKKGKNALSDLTHTKKSIYEISLAA